MSEPTDLDAGALDVMDAALAGESPTSNQGISSEGTEPDPGLTVEGEDDAEALEGAEKVVKAEGEEDPTGQGRQRDPATGKFLPKAAAAAEKPAVVEKTAEIDPATGKPKVEIDPATGKPKVAAAKEPDPINDPLPKDAKQETRARIEKLIEVAKEKTGQYEQVQESLNAIVQAVNDTGSTPQQYGELLSWMGLFNSPDTAQKEKALELAESVCERLSTMLGRTRTFNDPVAGHADLIAELQASKLTPQRAREIAIQRNQQKLNADTAQYVQQQQTTQQAAEQAVEQARTDLTALGQSLEATDPQYLAKKAQILPALKIAFESVPPNQWKGMFERAYRNVVLPRAAPAAVVPRNQPLRGNRNGTGGSGTATTPVTDPMAVMNAALDSMRG